MDSKKKIQNNDSLFKGRFNPVRGSHCVAVIKIVNCVGKMVTANAVKVMECHNFQEFQNYREGKIAFIHDSAQLTHSSLL